MTIRFGNSGDFHALVPTMRQSRERRAELDSIYHLRLDADERFHRWIGDLAGDPRSMMLVAEEAGKVVGFLIATVEKWPPFYLHEQYALVREWWIDPAFEDSDAGKALIDRAAAELTKLGIHQIRICTPESALDARERFERLGFRAAMREMVLKLSDRRGRNESRNAFQI